MEEPSLLIPVEGIVGRVQVQDNPIGGSRVSLEKDVHEEPIHGSFVQDDLLVAALRSGLRRQF